MGELINVRVTLTFTTDAENMGRHYSLLAVNVANMTEAIGKACAMDARLPSRIEAEIVEGRTI